MELTQSDGMVASDPQSILGTEPKETEATASAEHIAANDRLHETYHEFQDSLEFRVYPRDGSLKSLVTFDDSKLAPIHRWFTFKEGYSPQLLCWLRDNSFIPKRATRKASFRLLDPFCGVGTTLLSSQLQLNEGLFSDAIGVEYNPVISAIAKAKSLWSSYDLVSLGEMRRRLMTIQGRNSRLFSVPSLSTFSVSRENDKHAFSADVLQDLLYYKTWIDENCSNSIERAFFGLAWTSIIESCSRTKKDGRALRLMPNSKKSNVMQALFDQLDLMIGDVEHSKNRLGTLKNAPRLDILRGSAMHLPLTDDTFDVVCYSPPYLNNIDYTEVYKLELWLSGNVTNAGEFRKTRLGSMRSHPSITFPKSNICDSLTDKSSTRWIRKIKASLSAAAPTTLRSRETLFANYIDDLLLALKEQWRVARPGAVIVCVIGNSLHGGEEKVAVCSDLLVAAAAQAANFAVVCIQEARRLPRRDHQNGWLRESIVILRKPVK